MVLEYKEVVKFNPTWKEYFTTKKIDGFVRGFYDYITDDIWIWRGTVLHRSIKENMEIPDHAWKFILETERFTILGGPPDGEVRTVNKLKVLEPNSKEEKGWLR